MDGSIELLYREGMWAPLLRCEKCHQHADNDSIVLWSENEQDEDGNRNTVPHVFHKDCALGKDYMEFSEELSVFLSNLAWNMSHPMYS